MASSNLRVVSKRRETITALPLYHSGHLLKKAHKEKDFKKYYAELRGATLFLYNDDTQQTYAERLDLDQLKPTDLDLLHKKKTQAILKLHLPTEEVQLKIDNDSTREEWRGFILTVVEKEIPSQLELMRGQIVKLEDTLAQEKRRNLTLLRPPVPPRPSFLHTPTSPPVSTSPPKEKTTQKTNELPSCYFDVTREEAERMLDKNPKHGGIILRPSAQGNNYALTLRQETPSGPVKNNFKVSSTKAGFVIELDKPVTVSSLNEVLEYFLEQTEHRLRPYQASLPYDTRIEVPAAWKGNNVSTSSFKTLPQAQVAPMQRPQTKEEPHSPPTEFDQGDYLDPDDVKPQKNNVSPVRLDGDFRQEIVNKRRELRKVTGSFGVFGDYEN